MHGHSSGTTSGITNLANVFELDYRGQRVSYTRSNIAGQPLVSVGRQQFMGPQVTVEDTQIGELVTVALSVVADGDTTLLSLVLPPTRLSGSKAVDVQVLAIETTVRGTIVGPPLGQGMLYDIEEIEGTASFIVS